MGIVVNTAAVALNDEPFGAARSNGRTFSIAVHANGRLDLAEEQAWLDGQIARNYPGTLLVTLNRPDKRNAINCESMCLLDERGADSTATTISASPSSPETGRRSAPGWI